MGILDEGERQFILQQVHQYLKLTSTGCLEWQRGKTTNGYGVFWRRRKPYYIHRLIYAFAHGELEKGQEVCHRCDNPACGNIEHLFLGDHTINMADAVQKGRLHGQWPRSKQALLAAQHLRRTKVMCKYGHVLDGDNVRIYEYKNRRMRICIACRTRRDRERKR